MKTDTKTKTADAGQNVRGDIVLNSGRTVHHERMSNGAQHAFIANSATGEMTEAEWINYCEIILKS